MTKAKITVSVGGSMMWKAAPSKSNFIKVTMPESSRYISLCLAVSVNKRTKPLITAR